jgi:cytochrome c2
MSARPNSVRALVNLGPVLLLALAAVGCDKRAAWAPPATGGNAERGRATVIALECGACHAIEAVRAARGTVGPPLDGFARRVYLAGKWPNEPRYLVPWLLDPPAMAPHTAMPALLADEAQARDIAAFLYTLD